MTTIEHGFVPCYILLQGKAQLELQQEIFRQHELVASNTSRL